jgi:hypothetical protein
MLRRQVGRDAEMRPQIAVEHRIERAQAVELGVDVLDRALAAQQLGGGERVVGRIGEIADPRQRVDSHAQPLLAPLIVDRIAGESPARHQP